VKLLIGTKISTHDRCHQANFYFLVRIKWSCTRCLVLRSSSANRPVRTIMFACEPFFLCKQITRWMKSVNNPVNSLPWNLIMRGYHRGMDERRFSRPLTESGDNWLLTKINRLHPSAMKVAKQNFSTPPPRRAKDAPASCIMISLSADSLAYCCEWKAHNTLELDRILGDQSRG
jgi:hypothetical protein